MFILVDKNTGGVYAVSNDKQTKTVHMFEQKEDAERYMGLLDASNYGKPLELMNIDVDAVAINSEKIGNTYAIVYKNDLVVPHIK